MESYALLLAATLSAGTVLALAAELGLPTAERRADRTELYVADEVFLCGTGQELVPVATIDHLPVGDGKPVDELLDGMAEALLKGEWEAQEASELRREALLPQTPALEWDELMVHPAYMHALSLIP